MSSDIIKVLHQELQKSLRYVSRCAKYSDLQGECCNATIMIHKLLNKYNIRNKLTVLLYADGIGLDHCFNIAYINGKRFLIDITATQFPYNRKVKPDQINIIEWSKRPKIFYWYDKDDKYIDAYKEFDKLEDFIDYLHKKGWNYKQIPKKYRLSKENRARLSTKSPPNYSSSPEYEYKILSPVNDYSRIYNPLPKLKRKSVKRELLY